MQRRGVLKSGNKYSYRYCENQILFFTVSLGLLSSSFLKNVSGIKFNTWRLLFICDQARADHSDLLETSRGGIFSHSFVGSHTGWWHNYKTSAFIRRWNCVDTRIEDKFFRQSPPIFLSVVTPFGTFSNLVRGVCRLIFMN
jgi:hypothetical protein